MRLRPFETVQDIILFFEENFDECFEAFMERMRANKENMRQLGTHRIREAFSEYGTHWWNNFTEEEGVFNSWEEGADGPVYETMLLANGHRPAADVVPEKFAWLRTTQSTG